LIKSQKHLPERQRIFSFKNFYLGYSERVSPTSIGEHGLYNALNIDFIIKNTDEGKIIAIRPRYGTQKISSEAISPAPTAVYYYESQDQYILANSQKLYYLDSNGNPVEIGDIEGTPKFVEFNGRLIVCDGGTTKVWDGSTFDKLNDSWDDIVIGTGDGTETNFTGTLSHTPIEPGTLYIYYTAGGETKTIQDDGEGNLTGDVDAGGTNTINYTTGAYDFTCSSAPDNGTDITADWQESEAGPKSQGGVVRGARLYLWGDSDNPSRLYWSDQAVSTDSQAHNRWSSSANGGYVDVNPRDGSAIVGAENFYNVLVVVKENGIYKVLNYPEDSNFAVVAAFDFGAISKNAVASTGYGLVVLTKEGLVHLFSTEKFGDIDRALLTDDIDLSNLLNSNSYLAYNPISGQIWFTGYDSDDSSYNDYCHVVDMETKLLTKYKFAFTHNCYGAKTDKMLIGGSDGHLYELSRDYVHDGDDKFDIIIQSGFTNWNMPLYRFHNKEYSVELYSKKGFSFDFYLYKDNEFATPTVSETGISTGIGDETVGEADEAVGDATITMKGEGLSKWRVFNYNKVMFKIDNFDGLGMWELHRVDLTSAILGGIHG